jgi:hypothetical protein
MFTQDSQIDPDEGRWLLKKIARSIRKLSSRVLVVISLHDCPPQYRSTLLSLFYNQIHIASIKEPSRLHVKVSSSNLHHHQGGKMLSSSFILTRERERVEDYSSALIFFEMDRTIPV